MADLFSFLIVKLLDFGPEATGISVDCEKVVHPFVAKNKIYITSVSLTLSWMAC
jgi:hypothetical protein